MVIKTAIELASACENVAKNYKTLYVMGCFGAPMTAANKPRYCENYSYNRQASRTKMIQAASEDTFGFDCVCLIKGLLWGWDGSKNKVYGGAKYATNNVPDIGADAMITKCSDISTDFSKIQVGELLWKKGHVGIYIGNGLAVECTPAWKNCVQITACNCTKSGYNRRDWTKHGKLPYVTYATEAKTTNASTCTLTLKTLGKGSKGNNVKAAQTLLINAGYNCGGYGADGNFGSYTEASVRDYQKANKLATTGVVDKATWSKLLGLT